MAVLSLVVICSLGAASCGSGGGEPAPGNPDGAAAGGTATLAGTVHDRAGVEVSGAKVEVGSASVFSDAQGRYTLKDVPTGSAMVKVTRDWFQPLTGTTTVAASGTTTYDITIDELPLKVEAADRTLAERHAASFDWTKQKTSVAIAPRPTRRDFDNAIYWRNPALYRDTATIAAVTPSPQPQIAGGTASGFTFPVRSGVRKDQEALELATIADAIGGTPLSTEPAEYMLWTPMTNWLKEWDPIKSGDLIAVGTAVRQQGWGGNAVRPQDIEKVFLTSAGELWVKVVFAGFVQLGAGIADDDGDGQKEIYARIPSASYTPEVIERLKTDYAGKLFNTHGLSKELTKSLNELYSTTAAMVERTIGQPYEVPDLGTFMYPFVVLKHAGGQHNVILVTPAP